MTHGTAPTLMDRLLESLGRSLSPEFARELLALRADPEVQARADELASRCNEGTLTPEERSEYEGYVTAAHLIGVLQAKGRAVVGDAPGP